MTFVDVANMDVVIALEFAVLVENAFDAHVSFRKRDADRILI
ncbi:hypothetical protein GCM10009682_63210 [Luedemannella flava]|uniref:Uncharacterized protein n=1 Tax=Luedemannella flava TaxID=349316 RepID=A0ABN2MT92_9ACTN